MKRALDRDPSFALLIRVWFEDGPDGFRARLTALRSRSEPGEPSGGVTVTVTTSPGQVMTAVSDWLDALHASLFGPG